MPTDQADPAARRAQLYALLGDLPPRDRPTTVETIAIEEHPGYRLERLVFDLNGTEPVPVAEPVLFFASRAPLVMVVPPV